MSKAELIKKIATETGESHAKVRDLLNAFVNVVQDSVASGEDVALIGFGTFYRAHRKATKGRNPRNGQEIQIKAANLPKFRAGKQFKDVVNG
mgnify:CR=1 FL=1